MRATPLMLLERTFHAPGHVHDSQEREYGCEGGKREGGEKESFTFFRVFKRYLYRRWICYTDLKMFEKQVASLIYELQCIL